jgi:DNA-binding beta-propeller fold protein YncE
VATNAGIAVLARSPADGSLRQLPGVAGCISASAAGGCTPARALRAVGAIALSPDGGTLYATTRSQAVAVLARDRATGGLAQPAGEDGCANATGADGCRGVAALTMPFAVAVSPDGRNVYVGSLTGALFGFSRR